MSKGILTIDIIGGLGNQLFQIFFLMSVAKKYEMKMVFPNKYWLSTGRSVDTVRHTYYQLFPTLAIMESTNKEEWKIIQENQFTYEPIIIDPNHNYKFKGFFQSWKYIDQTINLPDHYILPSEDQKKVSDIVSRLQSTKMTLVGIHIRRGDALPKQDFHNVLGVNYVKNGIKILEEKGITNILFVVFSDGLEWCKENFGFLNPVVFIEDVDYIEMTIMSQCDHLMIANSTFSWWGAYLNKNPDKIIIYPSKWFEVGIDTRDLCPSEWIKCQV